MTKQISPSFDVDLIRRDFPFLGTVHPSGYPIAYLDNGASTQHPRAVLESMQSCYESSYANVHRGVHHLSELATSKYEAARERIAKFIHAGNSDQVIFTPGCTAALNLVAHGWGRKFLSPGDTILITQMEHHANIVPWFQLQRDRNIKVEFVKVTEDGQLDTDDWNRNMQSRPKLVSITAVSNVLGTINPLQQLISQAHAFGATVCVDAAQAAPHHELNVISMDCDFLAFSGHKMLGPSGIGVLYGKDHLLEAMDPFMGGGGMIDVVTEQGFTCGMIPSKFEAGTPPIVEAVGLAAAADYLDNIGLDQVEAHEKLLTQRAYEGLSQIDGLKILGPSVEHRAGIISFTMERVHAHDVAQILDSFGIAVRPGHHCTMPLHDRFGIAATARASFYIYNTIEEVDRLVEAVRAANERFANRGRHRRS